MAKVLRRFNSDLVVCVMHFGYKRLWLLEKYKGKGSERKRSDVTRLHLVANNSLPRSNAITEDCRTSFQQIVTRPLQGKLHDIKRNTLKKRFKETLRLQRSSSQLTRIQCWRSHHPAFWTEKFRLIKMKILYMKDQEHDDNVTASDNSENKKKTSLRTDGEIGRSGWVNWNSGMKRLPQLGGMKNTNLIRDIQILAVLIPTGVYRRRMGIAKSECTRHTTSIVKVDDSN